MNVTHKAWGGAIVYEVSHESERDEIFLPVNVNILFTKYDSSLRIYYF